MCSQVIFDLRLQYVFFLDNLTWKYESSVSKEFIKTDAKKHFFWPQKMALFSVGCESGIKSCCDVLYFGSFFKVDRTFSSGKISTYSFSYCYYFLGKGEQ